MIDLAQGQRLAEVSQLGINPKVPKKTECLKNCLPVGALAGSEPFIPGRLQAKSNCVSRMTAHSWSVLE